METGSWMKTKRDPSVCSLSETHHRYKNTSLKWKDGKRYYTQIVTKIELCDYILVGWNRQKQKILWHKEGYYILIQILIQ